MKQLNVLPLVAIISGLMVGCGGGSGGGGGGGATPSDVVTLTFIQKVTTELKPSDSCTLFGQVTENGVTTYTYARKAADVTVYIHDAVGNVVETKKPDANGILRLDKYPLEQGSYITVIDSPSGYDPFYKALSIQKKYLESQLIQVNRPQVDNCYTADSSPKHNTGFVLATTQNVQADSYEFLSSRHNRGVVSSNLSEVEKNTDEEVLIKGYSNNTLSGYTFASKFGSASEPFIVALEQLDTDMNWSNQLSSDLESLKISVSKGKYSYSWYEPNVTIEEEFSISSLEKGFHYQAEGILSTGWKFKTVGQVDGTLDVNLPDSLVTHDVAPSIVKSGLNGIVDVKGVNSSNELVVRAKYTQSVSTPTIMTLEHVIVASPDNGVIIIPDLTGTGLASENPQSLTVDTYEFVNLSEGEIQSLLSQYESTDAVAFVIKPSQKAQHDTDLRTLKYTQLSR
ncbi:flagellar sheath protein A [Vibrio sp. PNB23_22_7]